MYALNHGPNSLLLQAWKLCLQKYIPYSCVVLQINMDFEKEHGDLSDNFISKWESFYRERIIKLGESGYPAVKDAIQQFEEGDNNE